MSAEAVQDVAWNLEDLVDGDGQDGALALLEEAKRRADAFAAAHAGKVAELDGTALATAMAELEAISELAGRAGNYAHLRFAADTADPANGALVAKVSELGTQIQTTLLFFELEWAALEDGPAERLLGADGLDRYRHHLRTIRRYRPHLLTEPEERIFNEKAVTGSSAWSRLFDEVTSAIKVDLGGDEPIALDAALSRLTDPDRDTRAAVAAAVTEALEPTLKIRAYIFNTLLQDKATDDRLRSYPTWISSRNLSNEASDESVQALVDTVKANYELARRWYRLKAQLLGIERLADYDRMAFVGGEEPSYSWDQGKQIVLDTYYGFSEVMGATAQRFFDERWVDAPLRPAKRGGAFCAYTVPSVHPYLLLNWTDRRRDVLTLAHEMGHGLHAALAVDRGIFEFHTPLTVCETASVFGEALVGARLLDEAQSSESRLSLLAEEIEGSIATVFRQIAMNQFEHAVHSARRDEGELAVERFGELWAQTQHEMLGDAVELTDGYRDWWSYVPHFIGAPGYVYAYAYGQLLALSVYGRYLEEGESFVPAYVEMLSAGGSKPPEELAAIAGLDLQDPGFWQSGLDLVAAQLDKAEAAAREVIAAR